MKVIYVLIGMLIVHGYTTAQPNFFAGGLGVCIPQGDLKAAASPGLSVAVFGYERAITDKFRATLSLNYMSFGKKTVTAPTIPPSTVVIRSTMVPIQAGAKYYLSVQPGRRFFVLAETGMHFLTGKIEVNGVDNTPPNEVHFSYDVGAGYKFLKFELSYKYQWILADDSRLTYSDIALRYFFTFKKKKDKTD